MNDQPCPKCGHCPTCGRSNTPPSGWWQWHPTYSPPWTGPYWTVTSGTSTGNSITFSSETN